MKIFVDEKARKIADFLEENGIATSEEIVLVTSINGYNEETMNDILFARTGYYDIDGAVEYGGYTK